MLLQEHLDDYRCFSSRFLCFCYRIHEMFTVIAAFCHTLTYHRSLNVLPELVHRCVGDTHVPEHSLHFGSELEAHFCLQRR